MEQSRGYEGFCEARTQTQREGEREGGRLGRGDTGERGRGRAEDWGRP